MCESGFCSGGELVLVSLDVNGSLDQADMQVNKQVHPINQEREKIVKNPILG